MKVALLAGGTGGGKLAAGLQAVVGNGLSVIANTADDIEIHGLRVSPDPDLCTYWLSDEIDEQRGWGIRDDAFVVSQRLEQLGAPGWFSLSDRDLATCIYRTHFLAEGGSLTAAQAQIARALGCEATVLPMSEQRIAARVKTEHGWRGLQEFLIIDRGEGAVEAVELEGIEQARTTPEVELAIAEADVIVIGPSNPVISIGPILAVSGMREALAASGKPIVAISPLVGGKSVKGPTEAFVAATGRAVSAAGIASLYGDVIAAMIVDSNDPDPPPDQIPTLVCSTLMVDRASRRALATRTLEFAATL